MTNSEEPYEDVLLDEGSYKDYAEVPIFLKLWFFNLLCLPLLLLIFFPGRPISWLSGITLIALALMWTKNIYYQRKERIESLTLSSKILYTAFCALVVYLALPDSHPDYGTRIKIEKGELYYTESVDADTAGKLGEFFKEQEYFDRKITIQINREQDVIQIRMPVKAGAGDDPETVLNAKRTLYMISEKVLPKVPLEFHFCDRKMQTLNTIEPLDAGLGAKLWFKLGRMYYTGTVTREQAEAMAKRLEEGNFSNETGYMIQYDKVGLDDVLRFVHIHSGGEIDDSKAQLLRKIMADSIAMSLGDNHLRVELLVSDSNFKALKTIKE